MYGLRDRPFGEGEAARGIFELGVVRLLRLVVGEEIIALFY
jgi:hypothetical protein